MVRANARSVSATCRLAMLRSGCRGIGFVAQPTDMRTTITAALEIICVPFGLIRGESMRLCSARELEALEAVQCVFDSSLAQATRAIADPGPLLHQQPLPLAIGLEIDDGDDFVPDEHGLCEVAEQPLVLGDVGFEAMRVVEEQMQPLALMDERVEGRQDVDVLMRGIEGGVERLGPRPVLQRSGSFELDGQQLIAAHSGLDQSSHGRLAPGVQIAGRINADDTLRSQRTVE